MSYHNMTISGAALMVICLLTTGSTLSHAQSTTNNSSTNTIVLSIPNQTIVSSWHPTTGMPTFTISAINSLFQTHGVSKCEKAFADSRYPYMQKIYKISCTDTNLVHILHTTYPQYFPKGYVPLLPMVSAHYPNDYLSSTANHKSYLDYIKAPDAWGITKGSPDVIIGINDTRINTEHPDLQYKIAFMGPNTWAGSSYYHGTAVAGFAAGATNNSTGISAIGYNCRLDFEQMGTHTLLRQSKRSVPILNASWYYGRTDELDLSSGFYSSENAVFNEIYENGSFMLVAAGNGNSMPWQYTYPASLDNVFSTTHIGWFNNYGSPAGTHNVKNVYQRIIGDTITSCHNRNSRVDLMAPAHKLGGLTEDFANPSIKYTYDGHAGTSFASPMVAGTAGLMKSLSSCLTPYQLEYLLKTNANDSVLALPENMPFYGRIGAGALDAFGAVQGAKPSSNPCNSVLTQTMFIKGVELTSICQPGLSSNGHNPKLKPVIENGTPPYTYRWEAVNDGASGGNQTSLNAYNIEEPTITFSYGGHKAVYRVWVYDNSPVQKVASKYIEIQLTSAPKFDLASRDSYMDMMDEANSQAIVDPREWQIWESPDLWVRRNDDNGTAPQNPEYFATNPNHVYVRVRNVGCMAAPANAGTVRLYWSKASTGENWAYDWDGTNSVGASSGGVIPGGGVIPSGPQSTPGLQPGQSAILKFPWHPTKPQDFYGSPTSVDVCLLSRIEQSGPNFGMTIPEVHHTSVTPNVRNNNNIVTRNLLITDLLPGNLAPVSRRIFIANAQMSNAVFNIELLNNRTIHPQFSGDFSAIGRVRVHLGPLYDRWMQAGGQGSYTALEPNTKSVIFNGVDPLRLLNVPFQPGEKFDVKFDFLIDNEQALTGNSFLFHLRQFNVQDPSNVSGNVSLQVNTQSIKNKPVTETSFLESLNTAENNHFTVYPNPADEFLNIKSNLEPALVKMTIYDVSGKVVYSDKLMFEQYAKKTIDISNLSAGIHIILIETKTGLVEKHKFVKK